MIFPSPGWSSKRESLRAQKRGIQLHWIRCGGFMSAVISWNSNFQSVAQFNILTLIYHPSFFFNLFFMSSGKERQKLWSPSFLSLFTNPVQLSTPDNTGFVLQQFRGERRANMWVFNGNNTVCFFLGGLTQVTSEAWVTSMMGVVIISHPFLRYQRLIAYFLHHALNLKCTEARWREMDAAENAK